MDNRRFRCCEQAFAISELVMWKWAAGSVRSAWPAGTLCGRPARPRTVSSATMNCLVRPGERGMKIGHACPPRHLACVQRRAASLLRVPPEGPLTCGFTAWRAITCSIYTRRGTARFPYGRRMFPAGPPCVSPGGRDVSRPGRRRTFPRAPVMFPPDCGGVSAGNRSVPPEGGRRLPRVPGAAVPMGPAPEPAAALFPAV